MKTWQRISAVILTATLLINTGGRAYALPPASVNNEPEVTILERGLILDWSVPEPQIQTIDGQGTRIEIPGFLQEDRDGIPGLPYSSVLVALPPEANPVVGLEQETHPLDVPLELSGDENEPVILEDLGQLRNVRLARLVIHPVTLDQSGNLAAASHMRVTVDFNAPANGATDGLDTMQQILSSQVVNPSQIEPATTAAQPDVNPASSLPACGGNPIAALQINTNQTGIYRVRYEDLSAAQFPVSGTDPNYLHIFHNDQDLPWKLEGDGNSSFNAGDSLIFFAQPRFSRWSNEDVYFLCNTGSLHASMQNISSTAGGPAGKLTVTQTVEQNKLYTPDSMIHRPIPLGRDGDRWVWESFLWQSPFNSVQNSYTFPISSVDTSQPATLTVWMIGNTSIPSSIKAIGEKDHSVSFTLNGNAAGSAQWDGKTATSPTFTVSGSAVHAGENNQLTLTLQDLSCRYDTSNAASCIDGLWLDAFQLRYALGSQAVKTAFLAAGDAGAHSYTQAVNDTAGLRVFNVTNPDQPQEITGFNVNSGAVSFGDSTGSQSFYVVSAANIQTPSSIRMTTPLTTAAVTGADYIIVSHKDFLSALQPLVNFHSAQGLNVVVEDVQAIYDAYGQGIPNPQAIHDYLQHAYETWNPRPTYALLVGDGTTDPKHYLPNSFQTYIPPFLVSGVDLYSDEMAADNRLVDFQGDVLPDMLIGRLPVNNLSEAQTVVNKIVGYSSSPMPGDWNKKVLLLADMEDGNGNQFISNLDNDLVPSIPVPPFQIQKLYYDKYKVKAEDVRQSLLDQWNQGLGMVLFSGHASIHQWSIDLLFHITDIPKLSNGSKKLPILIELTCFTGAFQTSGLSALDEALLRYANGGISAALAPATLGPARGHEYLAQGFFSYLKDEIIADQPMLLGEAVLAGKVRYSTQTRLTTLIDTYNLLGDPAMQINTTNDAAKIYLPAVQR